MGALREPVDTAEGEMFLSGSIGIALAHESIAAEDLLRNAESAMNRAKEEGRSRYELFDDGMRARTIDRLETENGLHRALDRGELEVFYQPKVGLPDGKIVGLEALLRWNRPDRGIISPADFIGVAEETGLILPIGAWVLEAACLQAKEWAEEGLNGAFPTISVNLSARQLDEPKLAARVEAVLGDAGVDPSRLCLEVTETALLREGSGGLAELEAVRRLGAAVAIDDFGTGYASLTALKALPLDTMKIDGSFVAGLGSDEQDTAIVAALIGLARGLGLTITAEGVETETQLDELRRLGCDDVQGFLFARPVPAAEALALLKSGI